MFMSKQVCCQLLLYLSQALLRTLPVSTDDDYVGNLSYSALQELVICQAVPYLITYCSEMFVQFTLVPLVMTMVVTAGGSQTRANKQQQQHLQQQHLQQQQVQQIHFNQLLTLFNIHHLWYTRYHTTACNIYKCQVLTSIYINMMQGQIDINTSVIRILTALGVHMQFEQCCDDGWYILFSLLTSKIVDRCVNLGLYMDMLLYLFINILCYIMLCYNMLYYVIFCCVILCYVILCYVMLLCYIMLC
jgi:hypothetical protein